MEDRLASYVDDKSAVPVSPNTIIRWLMFARAIIGIVRSEGTQGIEEANPIPIPLTNSRSPKRANERAGAGKIRNGEMLIKHHRSRDLSRDWRKKIAYLGLTSFMGAVAGASHWYANIWFNKERNDVNHELSKREAALMNKSDGKDLEGDFIWSPGDNISRYRSMEDAIRVAKEKWREIVPDAQVLIQGDSYVAEPQIVLDGLPVEIMDELNALYQQCEALGWWDEGNDDEVEEIQKTWKARIAEEIKLR